MMESVRTFDCDDWRVTRIRSGPPWHENTYLVREPTRGRIAVIDPGVEGRTIIQVLGEDRGKVERILLTHGHHDHVVGAANLSAALELPCLVGAEDIRLVRQAAMYGLRFAGQVIETPRRIVAVTPDVTLGDSRIEVQAAPGHTRGGVIFSAKGIAFTGDTLLCRVVGRCDLPGGDSAALQGSIDMFLNAAAPTTLIFPGHGEPWSGMEAMAWWSAFRSDPPALDQFQTVS